MTLYATIRHDLAEPAFIPPKRKLRPLTRDSRVNKNRAQSHYMRLAKAVTLGSGAYGIALTHPKDETKVIKIGPLDDGWLIWAAYCQVKRGTSPHLMKVYSIKRWEKHGIYVAVIERLKTEITHTPYRSEWSKLIRDGFNGRFIEFDVVGDYMDVPIAEAENFLRDAKNESLMEVLLSVQGFAKDNGLCRDMHSGNAMLREDGTIVITDPFSSNSAKALETLKAMGV